MNPPEFNLSFCKGGGGYAQPRVWEDELNPSSYPEEEQNITQDEKNMGYSLGLNSYYNHSLSPESAMGTATPTPDRELCPDLRIPPSSLTLEMSHLDFQGLDFIQDQSEFDNSLMQYPSSIEDYTLDSVQGSPMMMDRSYTPRPQAPYARLATLMMPTGPGGGSYPSDSLVSGQPSDAEKNNVFQRLDDAGNANGMDLAVQKKPKVEEMPTPRAAPALSEKEAAPAKVEEKEEGMKNKDKTEVPQKKRKRSQRGSVCEDSTEELLFACPLYRKYPLQNMDCVNRKLTRIRDVKQHLLRRHLAHRCPICKISLPSAAFKEQHIQERSCAPAESSDLFGPDGITQEVHDILKRKSHRGKPPTTKWYEVWEIIFGDTKREEDPFLGPMMDETAKLMRGVWKKEQQFIVKDVISDTDTAGVQGQAEQQMAVMLAMFEKVQDRFEARILELTHRETSSEKSSPLMAASQTLVKTKNTSTNKLITEGPREISHLPEGGDDGGDAQVYVQSGIDSLSAESGDQAGNYTFSSTKHQRRGSATPRRKLSNTRTDVSSTSDDVNDISRDFAIMMPIAASPTLS